MIRYYYGFLAVIFLVTFVGATSLTWAIEDRASPGDPARPDTARESEDGKPKDRGWYIGFGFGFADDKGLDDDGDGFKVYGGYRFNRYIALEGALVSLGEDLGPADVIKDGISVQAVATWPVRKKLGLFLKAGFVDWEERAGSGEFECFSFSGGFTCIEEEDKIDDGTSAVYGFGLDYHFSQRWSFRAEGERFVNVGEGDVDMISISSLFRF